MSRSIGIRSPGDAGAFKLYNPNRDVANLFPNVITQVSQRIDAVRWPYVEQLFESQAVTDEQLGQAVKAMLDLMATARERPGESLDAAMLRCGYLDLPDSVQVGILAYVGVVSLGLFWGGIRDLAADGKPADPEQADAFAAEGGRCLRLMRWPRVLRPVLRLFYRLRPVRSGPRPR